MHPNRILETRQLILLLMLVLIMASIPTLPFVHHHGPAGSYIVQAATSADAATAVAQAGGDVTHTLGIINGVAASLDTVALTRLHAKPHVTLHADVAVRTTAAADDDENDDGAIDLANVTRYLYPSAATDVYRLHDRKVQSPEIECKQNGFNDKNKLKDYELRGWGVTVAVIDTGLLPMKSRGDWKRVTSNQWPEVEPAGWDAAQANRNTFLVQNSDRCLFYRDFISDSSWGFNSQDPNGHGTHVVSTIGDNYKRLHAYGFDTPVGIAPTANLLVARALGNDGSGSYADVIAAIDWIVANKNTYRVGVLNLSLYAPVTGPYWADPLNQAVMRAWQSGIVVVTVAGNSGPEAATITAPGNVPYVITVGAVKSGFYTASGLDELADYSARGPTESAFVKPDLLVPASYTIAPLPLYSSLAPLVKNSKIKDWNRLDFGISNPTIYYAYYQLSGTSMAAAEVSGIVALILQANPDLTPDQVKYRLLSTARPAIDPGSNEPIYSIWEQGAGLVDAEQAIFATTTEWANQGLDIAQDLDPSSPEHYWGYTTWDETSGEFRLIDPQSGEDVAIWGGGRRSSAATNWIWSGGRRSSAADMHAWSGGRRSSAATDQLWAGSDRIWIRQQAMSLQSVPLPPQTDLVIIDEPEAQPSNRQSIWLPFIVQGTAR